MTEARVQTAGALAAGRQLAFLWGAVAVGLIVLSPVAPDLAEGLLPVCPFKTLTGLPCLTCGTTRAALALARFEVAEAIAVNPLATIAWIGLVAGGMVAGVTALAGRSLREPRWYLPVSLRLGMVAIVATNWLYLIWAGT